MQRDMRARFHHMAAVAKMALLQCVHPCNVPLKRYLYTSRLFFLLISMVARR